MDTMTLRSPRTKRSESTIVLEKPSSLGDKEPSTVLSPDLLGLTQLSAPQEFEIDLDELLGELAKLPEIV